MHPLLRQLLLMLVVLTLAGPVAATVYTIGPNGAYPNLTDAVADAAANPDNHEFRLQVGNYPGNIVFNLTGEKIWLISGGWNAAFTGNPIAPQLTGLHAGGLGGTVLIVNVSDTAQLLIRNLTVSGGIGGSAAGGIHGALAQDALFSLQDCRITGNQSAFPSAGLNVIANGTSDLEISRCEFTTNVATGSGTKSGVGAFVRANQGARIAISGSYFALNQATAAASAGFGVGLMVEGSGTASIGILDTVVEENTALPLVITGAGVYIGLSEDATVDAEGLRIEGNAAPNATGGILVQAYAGLSGTSDLRLGNSLIVNSNLGGLSVNHNGTGSGHITSCTIANHAGFGLNYSASTGNQAVTNTIVHDNQGGAFGLLLDTPVVRSNNLGNDVAGVNNVDPRFVDAATDFHLQATSPAINAGSNAFNASSFDFELNPRVVNGNIDIGAYEFQVVPSDAMFTNGFESPP